MNMITKEGTIVGRNYNETSLLKDKLRRSPGVLHMDAPFESQPPGFYTTSGTRLPNPPFNNSSQKEVQQESTSL